MSLTMTSGGSWYLRSVEAGFCAERLGRRVTRAAAARAKRACDADMEDTLDWAGDREKRVGVNIARRMGNRQRRREGVEFRGEEMLWIVRPLVM